MKTLYLDIFSGISGDMFIGAMLDLGVDFQVLEAELKKLGVDEYELRAVRRQKSYIEGFKFDVLLDGDADEHCHSHDHTGGEDHDHSHDGDEHSHDHGNGHDHAHSHDSGDEHSHAAADDEHSHALDHDHSHSHDSSDEHSHSHSSEEHEHSQSHSHATAEDEHDHSHDHDHDHSVEHDHAHSHSHGPGEHDHSHEGSRNHAQIRELIDASHLSDWVKEKSKAVFYRVAVAEAKVHGLAVENVHFHEVGAVDSIVDIVGACICLELLGKPRVLAAPVTEGTGFVMCAHGRFPVPTMATLEILGARGVPVNQCDEPHELVTPTGAAILAEFVEEFGLMTAMVAEKVGYGLGTRDNHTRPNVLRAVLGKSERKVAAMNLDWETDRVAVLETNLDDISAEVLGYFVERAIATGALDVFHTPVQMKKNRPGVLLTVMCAEGEADRFSEMILRETSAFGVRRTVAERRKLKRNFRIVKLADGDVTVKIGSLNGKQVQVAPEYDSCRELAEECGVPLKEIYGQAVRAAGVE